MKLIFASNNAHKLEEARAIMPDIQILSLAEIGCHEDIPETRPTLEGNSLQKATFVRDWCLSHPEHIPADVAGCFADDTGLEIDALNGEPGVYTARWAGPSCNPGSNRKKALALLAGETRRTARFRTIVTLLPSIPPLNLFLSKASSPAASPPKNAATADSATTPSSFPTSPATTKPSPNSPSSSRIPSLTGHVRCKN